MDGRLLVFCDEDVTLDESGNRLNDDIHKDILSSLELDLPMETDNLCNRDILFIDWKTFIPENLEFLNSVKFVGTRSADYETQSKLLFESMKVNSLMEKTCLDSVKKGPRIDFPQVAMNDFLNKFTELLEKNRIVQVLPCYSRNQDESITLNRRRIMQTWNDRNQTFLNADCPTITKSINTKILDGIEYEEFGEVYRKASNQMMEIMSKPNFIGNMEEQEVGDE